MVLLHVAFVYFQPLETLNVDIHSSHFPASFRPPPATLTMAAGGGGSVGCAMGLPDHLLLVRSLVRRYLM